MTVKAHSQDVNWLLNDLAQRLAGAEKIALLSSDGLMLGHNQELDRADAEHLAAVASGFQSLSKGASAHFRGGEVYQTVVEMANCFLMVTAASEGACLALVVSAEADLGMIAFEANRMVIRLGNYLSSAPRSSADV